MDQLRDNHLKIHLLGGFAVTNSEGHRIRFRTRSTDHAFAYLAWNLGAWIHRDALARLVWPDAEPSLARQSLRMALNSIRSQTGPNILESDQDSVRLCPASVEVDAITFLEHRDWHGYGGAFLGTDGPAWSIPIAEELEDAFVYLVLDALHEPGAARLTVSAQAMRVCPHRLELQARSREADFPSRLGSFAAPIETSSFVGRVVEVNQVTSALGSTRLATLTGIGGIGKTRIAGQVWRMYQPDSWFVRLSDVQESSAIPRAVLDALNIRPAPARTDVEQLTYVLGSLRGLLVLDNFEHLLPDTHLVETFLTNCPDIKILLTSQRALDIDGECEIPIGPMSQTDSETLFAERAESVVHYSPIAGVADLCTRLDGLPLALELAARKARVFTPSEMLDELTHRLDFLVRDGKRNPRHASIRAALDWSFERLSESEQDLLLKLCVFRGGFTRSALAQICQAERAPEELEQLINYAWVQRDPHHESSRYRLLESVRDYGLELLPPSLERELRRAHAQFFLQLAQDCMNASFSPHEPELHRQVHAEGPNLEATWQWCTENDPESALHFAKDLNWYWILKGLSRVGQERIGKALELAGEAPRPALVQAYQSAGNYWLFQGYYANAEPFYYKATEIARQFGDTLGYGLAQGQLAYLYAEVGEREKAIKCVDTTLMQLHKVGNPNWLGAAYTISALVESRVGDPERGRIAGERAVQYYREGGYPWGLASALNELAMAHLLLGNFTLSIEAQLESIALKQQSNAPRSLALSYVDLAMAYRELGRSADAAAKLVEAFDILFDIAEPLAFPVAFALAHAVLSEKGEIDALGHAETLAVQALGSLPPTRMHRKLLPAGESRVFRPDIRMVREALARL